MINNHGSAYHNPEHYKKRPTNAILRVQKGIRAFPNCCVNVDKLLRLSYPISKTSTMERLLFFIPSDMNNMGLKGNSGNARVLVDGKQ